MCENERKKKAKENRGRREKRKGGGGQGDESKMEKLREGGGDTLTGHGMVVCLLAAGI